MNRTLITTLTALLAVGMLAGFAGPVAAQEEGSSLVDVDADNAANSTVAQDQSDAQVSEQDAKISSHEGNATVNQVNQQANNQTQEAATTAEANQGAITSDLNISVDATPTEEDTGNVSPE